MRSRTIIITLIIAVSILAVALVGAIVYIVILNNEKTTENSNVQTIEDNNTLDENLYDINDLIGNYMGDVINSSITPAVASYNAVFEVYEGTNKTAKQVNELFAVMQSNNSQGTRKVAVDSTGVMKEEIDDTKTYNVELQYDDEGYVVAVKIEEYIDENEATTTDDFDKIVFNTTFTKYNGEFTGTEVNKLISEIFENNETNSAHNVEINSASVFGPQDIVETESYNVKVSFNADGWVSSVNIEKK